MKTNLTIMASLAVLFTAAAILNLGAENMPEIRFDLGQNILDTAKKSGAPRYSTGNVAGFISYELVDLPHDIPAHYTRPGYEIQALPLFAFSLYADEEHHNGLAVHTASLQFSKDAGRSHDAAKAFVEDLISQFQKGKWKRHIDELCPAVTGRSSFLNEAGEPEQIENCPLDPQYRLSHGDWIKMMRNTQNYEWTGDGVLATLNVRYSDDIRGITYSINLEFNDFSYKKRLEKANQKRDFAAGDAKGLNSTMTEKNNRRALKSRIEILEENAKRRGDMVIQR
jgi:hypothetical protein